MHCLQAQQAAAGSYPDLGQEPPPYPAFSSSLKSTSPHFGSNMLALLDKRGGTVGGNNRLAYAAGKSGAGENRIAFTQMSGLMCKLLCTDPNQQQWRHGGGILSDNGRSFMLNPTLKVTCRFISPL